MASEKELMSLKLVIDKQQGRVIFAESEKDFIDILFSFLTLPIGTVVRLLDKQSPLENMNTLYQSVIGLHSQHFQTEASKAMLIWPRSAAETTLMDLKVSVDDRDPRKAYKCTSCSYFWSLVPHARCSCGSSMNRGFIYDSRDRSANNDGGFVKGGALKFMITDDLQVSLASTSTLLSLFEKLDVNDEHKLESRIVEVDRDKLLSLLKACMSSTNSLSEVFLGNLPVAFSGTEPVTIDNDTGTRSVSHGMTMKIIKDKENAVVFYAEIGEDLVDLLFSFLTLPLGSLINLQKNNIKLGSLNNLYKSVEILADGEARIMSEYHKSMLLAPKLAPHFDISKQILNIDAVSPEHVIVNPKLPSGGNSRGGGFIKGPGRFMVTDDMVVTPLSLDSGIKMVKKLRVPISNLEERIVSVDEAKALHLLKACIISSKPLSEFFLWSTSGPSSSSRGGGKGCKREPP